VLGYCGYQAQQAMSIARSSRSFGLWGVVVEGFTVRRYPEDLTFENTDAYPRMKVLFSSVHVARAGEQSQVVVIWYVNKETSVGYLQ
jgi:hypothetical protein